MTNTVVAATDFSDGASHAVHRGARLAAQIGATLTLLHVVNRSLLGTVQDLFGSRPQAEEAPTANATRMLNEQAAEVLARVGPATVSRPRLKVVLGSVQARRPSIARGGTRAGAGRPRIRPGSSTHPPVRAVVRLDSSLLALASCSRNPARAKNSCW